MKENYRIVVHEWKEYTEIGCIPLKHQRFMVQKRHRKSNWFQRNILCIKDTWHIERVYGKENEAITAMTNLYNRENPTVNYIKY